MPPLQIEHSFDWRAVSQDVSQLNLLEIEYPHFLSEMAKGKVFIFDMLQRNNFLHIQHVDLAYFAVNLPFSIKKLIDEPESESYVTNTYQHYELILQKQGENCVVTAHQQEKETTITLNFEDFYTQAVAFRKEIFEALLFYYPHIVHHEQFEIMKHHFYLP